MNDFENIEVRIDNNDLKVIDRDEKRKRKAMYFAFGVLTFSLVFLFGLCGFSLVQCFVYNASGEDAGSHFLEITYLFLHLVMVAIVFYLAFRAFKIKSSIVFLMTLDVNGIVIKKARIISAILSVVFLGIGFYALLHVFGLQAPPMDLFPIGLVHDLMNAFLLFGVISLVFFLYPFVHVKEEPIKE